MEQVPSSSVHRESGQITFLDLIIVLARHKKVVFGLPLVAVVAAIVVALVLPNIYTATARILSPQQKESSAASILGVLAGSAGGTGAAVGHAIGLRNPNDLYASILRSRSIADRIIERFNLKDKARTMMSARRALEGITKVTAGKDGLITIQVDDLDPQRAADIANAYVEELDRFMQGLAVTEAAQRRLFFEKQLASARDDLVAAEVDLRKGIETKGIAGVDAQSRAVVGTAEKLRAQIAVKEIQLDAMRSFATERNPEAVRLRHEITSMKAELGNLEGGRREANGGRSPAGLENIRKLREVKFLEFTVELLTKHYEIAKIDEAKDAVLIQVVDKAVPPDLRSKPNRAQIVIVTLFAVGILALLLAFLLEAIEKARNDPGTRDRLYTLRQTLR